MCSAYWTVTGVEFTCPKCGKESVDDIQTHFMGDAGSCADYYKLGERVPYLLDMTVTLKNEFIGYCTHCEKYMDFGAEIKDGKVEKAWPTSE